MYFSKNKDNRLQIGKFNKLKVISIKNFGYYLDGLNYDSILLPSKYVPINCKIGDIVNVFIYKDSEDRLIATTEKPYATVGDFAFLKVDSVNNFGAFLKWGLLKDLMVPFREQKTKMEEGKSYLVRIYLDPVTERIVASSKVIKYIEEYSEGLSENEEVNLLIYKRTAYGFDAIVNNKYSGELYKNEYYQKLSIGQQFKGYIKSINKSNQIHLTLNKDGHKKTDPLSSLIMEYLRDHNGIMDITAKSSPEIIENIFRTSKRNFKVALGGLYKKRIISIEENKISLLQETEKEIENDFKNK